MSGNDTPKVTFFESPVSGWAQVPYNTREVLTESGEWISPITGYVKVTCIGGGQAGTVLNGGFFGEPGGKTTFGSIEARGGICPNMSNDQFYSAGAAGEVHTDYLKVSLGETVSYSIGAGGNKATITSGNTYNYEDYCSLYPGEPLLYRDRAYAGLGGGFNGTPYGGGGGAATTYTNNSANFKAPGRAGGEYGEAGVTGGSRVFGGNGGPGAIILEYADPKKKD